MQWQCWEGPIHEEVRYTCWSYLKSEPPPFERSRHLVSIWGTESCEFLNIFSSSEPVLCTTDIKLFVWWIPAPSTGAFSLIVIDLLNAFFSNSLRLFSASQGKGGSRIELHPHLYGPGVNEPCALDTQRDRQKRRPFKLYANRPLADRCMSYICLHSPTTWGYLPPSLATAT